MTIRKLTFILFITALISCRQERKAELTFDKCNISYTFYPSGQKELYAGHYMTNEMEIEAARRKLALCLCDRYILTQDTLVKAKITEILKTKEKYFVKPLGTDLPIDTILVHKDKIFDPTILID